MMNANTEFKNQVRIFDNGGDTIDRYTAVFLEGKVDDSIPYIGMCANPTSPGGFGQHGELAQDWMDSTEDDEIDLNDLPEPARLLVLNEVADYAQVAQYERDKLIEEYGNQV